MSNSLPMSTTQWTIKEGMPLRDYFAAKAMQGHLSNQSTTNHPGFDRESLAIECYQLADAMLAVRAKEKP